MKQQFTLSHAKNGVWYGTFSHFGKDILHGVSTRLHGCSHQPFQSLNLGLHTGDNKDHVFENRKLFATAVGIDPLAVVTAQQVHEDTIAIVTFNGSGRGTAKDYCRIFTSTDALITAEPNIPLMLFFADCVPVLFYDPVKRIVAISHAGWKGTVSRIAAKTLVKMQTEFNVNPGDVRIGIAPSIGQCCYEVDEDVVDKLRQEFGNWSEFVTVRGERWLLDLWEVNRQQLLDVGASAENIVISSICTSCNNQLYYSYRAEHGITGRLGAVIQL